MAIVSKYVALSLTLIAEPSFNSGYYTSGLAYPFHTNRHFLKKAETVWKMREERERVVSS